jgi:Mg-chelatase subunit ChlD
LLERLAPRLWEGSHLTGQGKHRTGKKLLVGEGRIIGTRAWRFGDRYRDVSLKDTMRQAIRNRHTSIIREDIQVVKRDIRTRMDIILCLDLSGTMNQLDKLWYAKESAIALSLASSGLGDRVGLVTFSNMAAVVSDLTVNTYRLTEKVLDLDLHENAFTNLGYGLVTARRLFARHSRGHSKQHIILVSDGDATAPQPCPSRYAIREAAKCIRKGITISCICINEENADPDLMHTIARIGRGRVTIIGDTQAMKEGIVEEMKMAIH